MKHFQFSKLPSCDRRTALREWGGAFGGIVLITLLLVGLFATFLYLGRNMPSVIPPHMDDGEEVNPSPMRLAYMLLGFFSSFFVAWWATRAAGRGRTQRAFLIGYAGGTLLWQSMGECAWHFSIVQEDFLTCFPHIEGSSALFLFIVCAILLAYCYHRRAFSWGVWAFVLSFVGNWWGHFFLIGSYPLVSGLVDEDVWFRTIGAIAGGLTTVLALLLWRYGARTQKARLCSILMFYFGIGMIVTGVAGL